MASKVVQVYVVDDQGQGLPKQRVKAYGGDVEFTDSDGRAVLSFDDSEGTIFVNGYQALKGYLSNLGKKAVFTRTGGKF